MTSAVNTLQHSPNDNGYYGNYGGRFVAETLMQPLLDLEHAYASACADERFQAQLTDLLTHYGGRPSPLYLAERLTEHLGGAQIWLKRDELNHTGSHKINNVLGQALLARRMGKTRVIAETGAGQHGVATATACALLGLDCVIFMGAIDAQRQAPNLARMKLLGARIEVVQAGSETLKDAMNEAMRDWVSHIDHTYYLIGSAAGPHPYPMIVRDFQSVIGKEAREQFTSRTGSLPDTVVACVGGGSNAIGIFHAFLNDPQIQLIGVEAGGHGLASGSHAAAINGGEPGVLHGSRTFVMADQDGQIIPPHSISAGLDYPAIGPEHAYLHEIGRVIYTTATDTEALAAFRLCARLEGIIPALEPAHALAHVSELAPTLPASHRILLNLCGRGDKDIDAVAPLLENQPQEP